jgi:hypothetical protein
MKPCIDRARLSSRNLRESGGVDSNLQDSCHMKILAAPPLVASRQDAVGQRLWESQFRSWSDSRKSELI